jgi:hypothetical protein
MIVSLLALACGEPSGSAAKVAGVGAEQGGSAGADETPRAAAAALAELEAASAHDEPGEASTGTPPTLAGSDAGDSVAAAGEDGGSSSDPADRGAAAGEPERPADPLAPILPSGPEPGSPEADAELAALLDESTLTQAEFDAAFRGTKPKIDGDQFVFGAGERTRKAPVVTIGTPTVTGSKVAASELASLAKADLRGFEGCLAVALAEAPTTAGSVTLRVVFDGDGHVSEARVEGGASLGAPLRSCLAAVADDWQLAAAAKATVGVPLSLRGK